MLLIKAYLLYKRERNLILEYIYYKYPDHSDKEIFSGFGPKDSLSVNIKNLYKLEINPKLHNNIKENLEYDNLVKYYYKRYDINETIKKLQIFFSNENNIILYKIKYGL